MRARLRHWLVLSSALVFGHAEDGAAKVYLSRDEAVRLAFGPQAAVSTEERALTPELREAVGQRLGRPVPELSVTFDVARTADGVAGYGLVLSELGKHEPITFFVAIAPDGHVKDVMVLDYRESRGGEVRQKGFLRQYVGKSSQDPLRLQRDITPISGATISARAISDGVKKALVIWEEFYR